MSNIKRLSGSKYTILDVKKSMNKQTRESLFQFAIWGRFGVDAIDWILDCDLIVKEAKLTDNQLTCMHLIWREGCTYKEASEVLDVSIAAIHQTVTRATNRIERILEKQGEMIA